MKNLICILSLLSLSAPRAAQSQQVFEREKRDYTWLLGYGGFAGALFCTKLYFRPQIAANPGN